MAFDKVQAYRSYFEVKLCLRGKLRVSLYSWDQLIRAKYTVAFDKDQAYRSYFEVKLCLLREGES